MDWMALVDTASAGLIVEDRRRGMMPTPNTSSQPEGFQHPVYDMRAVLRGASLYKIFLFPILVIRHLRTLLPLLLAPRGGNLRRLIRARPELIGIVLSRFLAANWDTRTRVARVVDHYRTVADIGGIVDFAPDAIVELVRLSAIDPRYIVTLDQARWLLREGPMIMSLWDGVDRIFHLGFCLSTVDGKRIAYVGSLQGRKETDIYNYTIDILNRYRHFTKAASGMRPRDFLVETFKMFCKAVGVSEIRAVSDDNHPPRAASDLKLSYDEIWIERGGHRRDDGFFILPVTPARRDDADIPAKKRSAYARRYLMLDAIEAELSAALRSSAGKPRD